MRARSFRYRVIFRFVLNLARNTILDGSTETNGIFMSITKLWIVIGCIAALVFIAVIQAGCTIYKSSRKPSKHHKVRMVVCCYFWFLFRSRRISSRRVVSKNVNWVFTANKNNSVIFEYYKLRGDVVTPCYKWVHWKVNIYLIAYNGFFCVNILKHSICCKPPREKTLKCSYCITATNYNLNFITNT